ncbi:MAG TPA: NAD(+)/NADH kinase [Gemmatimonadaceae bacterium]|nr:NAD(+)/NADH kinase [Gemmatimonadaceae bacterium]
MTTRLGVVGNLDYEGLPDVLRTLVACAPKAGMTLVCEKELSAQIPGAEVLDDRTRIDVMLTLGGDGTMLRGARLVGARQIPVLGINLGRLGFLTASGGEELERAVMRLGAGDYIVEPRMALEARTQREPEVKWRALNDVVLHKGGRARVIRIRAKVNGDLVGAYAADGIIVATPTGSTGYSLSTGGPVIVPTVESILLTAISAHTLGVRPLVLPSTAEIQLQTEDASDEILVTVDGQIGTTFAPGDTLVVRRAERPVLVVRFREGSFFSRLRLKLGWGGALSREQGG